MRKRILLASVHLNVATAKDLKNVVRVTWYLSLSTKKQPITAIFEYRNLILERSYSYEENRKYFGLGGLGKFTIQEFIKFYKIQFSAQYFKDKSYNLDSYDDLIVTENGKLLAFGQDINYFINLYK